MSETADLFRARLDQIIDLRHPLAVLTSRMPRQEIEASMSHRFAKQARAGKRLADVDVFRSTVSASGAGVIQGGAAPAADAPGGVVAVSEARF